MSGRGKLLSRDVSAFLAAKLDQQGRVILPGLGTLRLAERAARSVRHPKTGEIYESAPRLTLVFRRAKVGRGKRATKSGEMP